MRASLIAIVGFFTVAMHSSACLWDSDTLAMERARFPEAAALITGKFARHSKEFYQWRKGQSETALAKDAKQPAVYDDLAVAKHKLGDHRGAIETMMEKEKIAPGLYETYSNLGTFCIYTGELDEALKWIDKALAINPNAHFGREKYQKWLVEWIKTGRTSDADLNPTPDRANGFAAFILGKTKVNQNAWESQRAPALNGVLGMMLFADYDNPILLEALGDLLSAGRLEKNAAHLAAQAYLHARDRSAETTDQKRIDKKLEMVGVTTQGFKVWAEDEALTLGLAEGVALNGKVRADEVAWIRDGKDASAEFDKKYRRQKR